MPAQLNAQSIDTIWHGSHCANGRLPQGAHWQKNQRPLLGGFLERSIPDRYRAFGDRSHQ
jgi:hypothetical protein